MTRARKTETFHTAYCRDCEAKCTASNAHVWAFNHANRHAHSVELERGWLISSTLDSNSNHRYNREVKCDNRGYER